jgi:hypothetical protein
MPTGIKKVSLRKTGRGAGEDGKHGETWGKRGKIHGRDKAVWI